MKFATCNEYFEDWPIEKVFDYAAELGYDGVEIAPFTLAPSVDEIDADRRRQIRRAAADAGVEIIGLHWLLISPEGLYVNHPDDVIRMRTRDYFRSLVDFCGDLGVFSSSFFSCFFAVEYSECAADFGKFVKTSDDNW